MTKLVPTAVGLALSFLAAPSWAGDGDAKAGEVTTPRAALLGTDSHEVWINRLPPKPERDVVYVEKKPERHRKESYGAGFMVGAGAPSLFSGVFIARITRWVSVGASYGMIPAVHVQYYGEATVSYRQMEGFLRVHPFGGGFFVGSGLGRATVKATYTQDLTIPAIDGVSDSQAYSVRGEGEVKSFVATPHLGYLGVTRVGFLYGFDAGAQIPISSSDVSISTNLPPEVSQIPGDPAGEATTKVRTTLQRVGQQILPVVNVRVGFLF